MLPLSIQYDYYGIQDRKRLQSNSAESLRIHLFNYPEDVKTLSIDLMLKYTELSELLYKKDLSEVHSLYVVLIMYTHIALGNLLLLDKVFMDVNKMYTAICDIPNLIQDRKPNLVMRNQLADAYTENISLFINNPHICQLLNLGHMLFNKYLMRKAIIKQMEFVLEKDKKNLDLQNQPRGE